MTIKYEIQNDYNEMTHNFTHMTNDELKQLYFITCDLYVKYDDYNDTNRIAENFRLQIDLIANYMLFERFDKNMKQFETFIGIKQNAR